MKKFLLVLAILFISGIITADICFGGLRSENIWMNLDVFKAYAYSNVTFKDVIWNMIYERGKMAIGFIILGLTPLRNRMPVIFVSLFSFCFGFFGMSCVLEVGFVGVIIAISSVIPHGLFYVGMLLFLYRNNSIYGYGSAKNLSQIIATYLFVILLFVTGCIIECVMGVHFIPWIIRLSMV